VLWCLLRDSLGCLLVLCGNCKRELLKKSCVKSANCINFTVLCFLLLFLNGHLHFLKRAIFRFARHKFEMETLLYIQPVGQCRVVYFSDGPHAVKLHEGYFICC
jgi:hypothetical protein